MKTKLHGVTIQKIDILNKVQGPLNTTEEF